MIAVMQAAPVQAAASQACLKAGDTVAGEFRYVESRHPNGTPLRYGFLVTEEPVCVLPVVDDGGRPLPKVWGRWIQIIWAGDQTVEPPRPGEGITIMVGECFEPISAWHIGDIVCADVRLTPNYPETEGDKRWLGR